MSRPMWIAGGVSLVFAVALHHGCVEHSCYDLRNCPSQPGSGGGGAANTGGAGTAGSPPGPGGATSAGGSGGGVRGGDVIWESAFGDGYDDVATGIAALSDGSVVIGGYFSGSLDFGGGALIAQGVDAFVANIDGTGAESWANRYGTSDVERIFDVTADVADNVYVTGDFESTIDLGAGLLTSVDVRDLFTGRLTNGQAIWSVRMSGAGGTEQARYAAASTANTVVVLGDFQETFSIGNSSTTGLPQRKAMYLAKLSGGNPQSATWLTKATGTGIYGVITRTLTADLLGNVFFVGFAGNEQFSSTAVEFDGTSESTSGPGMNILYRTNGNGSYVWHVRFDQGVPLDVSTYANGDLLICGRYNGPGALSAGFSLPDSEQSDVWVARYNAIGVLQWARRYGGPGQDGMATGPERADDVRCHTSSDGGYLLAAYSDGAFNAGSIVVPRQAASVVIAHFQDDGTAQWVRRTTGDADVVDVVAKGDHAVIGLVFDGETGFDSRFTAINGNYDIFLARLAL
jgi:hypothetical protein